MTRAATPRHRPPEDSSSYRPAEREGDYSTATLTPSKQIQGAR